MRLFEVYLTLILADMRYEGNARVCMGYSPSLSGYEGNQGGIIWSKDALKSLESEAKLNGSYDELEFH